MILQHHGISSLFGESPIPPTPPTPTYEYLLLQNFVDGHDIGSPDLTKGNNWVKTIQSDSWYDDNYMGYESYGGNLLSNTVGDVTIDTSKPLDFSKYGITTGTPFAISTCNGDDYRCKVSFSIQNLQAAPLTIETFACGRPRNEGDDYMETMGIIPIFQLGDNASSNPYTPLPNLTFSLCPDDGYAGENNAIFVKADIGGNFDTTSMGQEIIGIPYWEPGVSNSMQEWVSRWHHYALSIDTNNMYMFVDGVLKATASLDMQLSFNYLNASMQQATYNKTLREFLSEIDLSTISVKCVANSDGSVFDARFAQVAVCQACKWTSDFVIPTEAY